MVRAEDGSGRVTEKLLALELIESLVVQSPFRLMSWLLNRLKGAAVMHGDWIVAVVAAVVGSPSTSSRLMRYLAVDLGLGWRLPRSQARRSPIYHLRSTGQDSVRVRNKGGKIARAVDFVFRAGSGPTGVRSQKEPMTVFMWALRASWYRSPYATLAQVKR